MREPPGRKRRDGELEGRPGSRRTSVHARRGSRRRRERAQPLVDASYEGTSLTTLTTLRIVAAARPGRVGARGSDWGEVGDAYGVVRRSAGAAWRHGPHV